MLRRRWDAIRAKRVAGPAVILDIAVPRDFDPRIHDAETAFYFNIDDLKRIRGADHRPAPETRHPPCRGDHRQGRRKKFLEYWNRRDNCPIHGAIASGFDTKR